MKRSIFISTIVALLTSCSYQANNTSLKSKPVDISKVNVDKHLIQNSKSGADVTIIINNKAFSKKAITDAVFPKTSIDVKSYQIFLTNDYNNPFNTGSNVSRDRIYKFDSDSGTTFTFTNIQDGGPYWAVISAWDGLSNDSLAQNITEPDLTLLSIDQKWARSTNSVTIISNNPVYSDSSTFLSTSLQLKQGIPASFDTSISILAGATDSTPEDITP